jgi:hypothetical protein
MFIAYFVAIDAATKTGTHITMPWPVWSSRLRYECSDSLASIGEVVTRWGGCFPFSFLLSFAMKDESTPPQQHKKKGFIIINVNYFFFFFWRSLTTKNTRLRGKTSKRVGKQKRNRKAEYRETHTHTRKRYNIHDSTSFSTGKGGRGAKKKKKRESRSSTQINNNKKR